MAETSTVCAKPSVLTEDMIDAAMSKSLEDEGQETDVSDQDKVLNDHNYCEEEYSSDYDYRVESVDGYNSDCCEDAAPVNNENACDKINQSNSVAWDNKSSGDVNTASDNAPSNSLLDKTSTVDTESVNNKPDTNFKRGLTVKPISNLLKSDFLQKSREEEVNVKIYKCINGKMELIPESAITPAEKEKFLKYRKQFHYLQNDPVPSRFDNALSSDFNKNMNVYEKSQYGSINYNNEFSPLTSENKSTGSLQVKSFANSSSINGSAPLVTSLSAVSSFENQSSKISSLSSILKPNTSKFSNISDYKSSGFQSRSTNTVTILPECNDTICKNVSSNQEAVDKSQDVVDITDDGDTSDDNYYGTSATTRENITNSNNRISVVPTKSGNISSLCKFVKVQPEGNTKFAYGRHVLPKQINYRYHTNNRVVTSGKLPNKPVSITSVNNNKTVSNATLYKLAPKSANTKSIVILPEQLRKQQNPSTQPVIRLKTPVNSTTSAKYVRNVISEIDSPLKNVPKNNSTTVQSNQKDKSPVITSSKGTWEKLDRFAIDSERHKSESGISALISQITERELPIYKPEDAADVVHSCHECKDSFLFESSLRQHRLRKSVLIKYWCRTCSCSLNMYNRCMFLAHLKSHNQLFKNIDMSCLTLEPLPKNLLRLDLNIDSDYSISVANKQPSSSVADVPVSESSTVPTASLDISLPSFSSTVTTVNSQLPSACKTSTITDAAKDNNRSLLSILESAPRITSPDMCNSGDLEEHNTSMPVDNALNDIVMRDLNERCEITFSPDKNKHANDKEITIASILGADTAENLSSNIVNTDKTGNSKPVLKAIQVRGRRKCPECGILLSRKCSLRKHLQNKDNSLTDCLKCNACQLLLPSGCSLKMHLRVHMKAKPFRCPECGLEFTFFDRFMTHLKFTCYHMFKITGYVCTVCNSMHSNETALERHLLSHHVRSIFKCGSCPVAFVSAKSAEKHKQKEHAGRIVPTLPYQQCKLCPEKLIPKRKFLLHMKTHLTDKACISAYECPNCKSTFLQRMDMAEHRMKCDPKGKITSPLLNENPNREESSVVFEPNMNEVEFVTPSKKQKLSSEDELEMVPEEEKDPLSLEDFEVEEQPLQEPRLETCIMCKKEKVLILPGKSQSSQSMCCNKCVSPCGLPRRQELNQRNKLLAAKQKGYKCKICNSATSMDLKSIFVHFKDNHREFEGQSINEWLIIENRTVNGIKSKTIVTAETIKEKYKKKRVSIMLNSLVKQIKEETNVDANDKTEDFATPETKKPKKYFNKVKQKAAAVPVSKSFESGQIITAEESENAQFSCSKCDFIGKDKEALQRHVVMHRSDPNALQCLECGECFVVLPSLEKHLIINHRITDVSKYFSDNKQFASDLDDKQALDGTTNDESVADRKCKVCHIVFQTKVLMEKHFRSHGMAFLLKKKPVVA